MSLQALIDSVVKGDESAVNHVLSMGADIHEADSSGLTPLHWTSASAAAEALVPYLLSCGAKLDVRDNLGHTPLHLHCARGRSFGASCLLHQGSDTNARTQTTLYTPLHLASKFKHAEIAKVLLAYVYTVY